MITAIIQIDSLEKIQNFVGIISSYRGKMELISGCSRVNARSIMGIFSLDISQPLCLNIYDDEQAACICQAISSFLISDERKAGIASPFIPHTSL